MPEENKHSICEACSSPAIDAAASSRQAQKEEILANASLASGSSLDTSLSHSNIFLLNSMNRSTRNDFEKEDIHEIRDDQMEAIPSAMLEHSTQTSIDNELPTEIHGPPSLQEKLRSLILEYKDIFSRKVRKEPAKLPPFNFSVDQGQWESYRNKTHPRRYDSTKSAALQKIVEQLLDLGVIVPSDAAFYSHGFPVPKSSPGAWRLVVDLKNLTKFLQLNRGLSQTSSNYYKDLEPTKHLSLRSWI